MSGPWMTVWDIAGKRHMTKAGEGHLTEHAHEVLQGYMIAEAQDTMANALGGLWSKVLSP